MKKYIIALLVATLLMGCTKTKIGYMKADNAEYIPNILEIRTELDPVVDAIRIKNNAPWVTMKIAGVLGTDPLMYSLVSVKALDGGDAEIFKSELKVLGRGVMQVPLVPKSPKGKYVISLKVSNEDYSANLTDIYTFIIK